MDTIKIVLNSIYCKWWGINIMIYEGRKITFEEVIKLVSILMLLMIITMARRNVKSKICRHLIQSSIVKEEGTLGREKS